MEILFTVFLFLPFIFLLWLANLAERAREEGAAGGGSVLAFIAVFLIVILDGFLILMGSVAFLMGLALRGNMPVELQSAFAAMQVDAISLSRIGLGLWLPGILGLVLLLPPVRRWLARVIPIDPASPVHAVALSYSALILVQLLVTLGMGLDNLARLMEASSAAGQGGVNLTGSVWAQDITLAFMAMVGVGWLSRKRFGSALQRLGLVVPTWKQGGIGLAVGLLLVPAIILLEQLFARIGLGTNPDVERLTEELIGPLVKSVPGILTLGLAAALGEETIFRGALQPRFGLLLTAVLFALLHSNYGITLSTLLVFLVGLVLGLLRLRWNTTTSMITHATYNITLGIIAYVGLLQNL